MTYHPDSVLVEKVAKAIWRESVGWRDLHGEWEDEGQALHVRYRLMAEAAITVACPLVAGVIADRLDGHWSPVNGAAAEFVRREFVDGEA